MIFPELPVAVIQAPEAEAEGFMHVFVLLEADRLEEAAAEADVCEPLVAGARYADQQCQVICV